MKALFSAFIAVFLLATPLIAQEAEQPLNNAERAAIEQVVRDYILSNPEIIPEAIRILQRREQEERLAELKAGVADYGADLANPETAIVGGNPDGTVTLVEFYDYRCPYCEMNHPDIERLMAENPDLRILYRQFPIKDRPGEYPLSLLAAKMAIAATRQGGFEAFHDTVFAYEGTLSEDVLFSIAEETGLDTGQLRTDMDDPQIIEDIRTNMRLAVDIGFNGTPTYVVGETILEGAQPYSRMQAAVDAARQMALASEDSD